MDHICTFDTTPRRGCMDVRIPGLILLYVFICGRINLGTLGFCPYCNKILIERELEPRA